MEAKVFDYPNRHVNFLEIEDSLRTKMGLSVKEWQVLMETSVAVEADMRRASGEARAFAEQDKAARKQNPLGGNTLAAGRATLHGMQLDLNTHV